jgi:catalase
MTERAVRRKSPALALAGIAGVIAVAVTGFAYTAGWLSPHRVTPQKMVTALQPPGGPALGHRRNHAKGICFTGTFSANGAGSALSTAQVFAPGKYPVIGRLNIPGGDPHMPDALSQARGFSMRILTPDGQEWRSAMLDAPFFTAATPDLFYQFISAAASKDPSAVETYLATHPETVKFIGWARNHPRTESWTEDRFNSLNSFVFIDASGSRHTVRWSLIPSAQPVVLSPQQLAQRSPDFLQQDIVTRVAAAPRSWELVVTVAGPGDPTSDPTQVWPADRRTVDVGTLTAAQVEPEADGPCRDINYDPSVLPAGMTTSDDGFPAARSAAYRVSFDRRTAEETDYPHTVPATSPATAESERP